MTLLNKQLKDIVSDHPASLAILEKYQLDFCCSGTQTLQEAVGSMDKAKELESLLLQQFRTHKYGHLPQEKDEKEFKTLTTPEMVDYIINRFHEKIRYEEPIIKHLANNLESTHSDRKTEFKKLNKLIDAMFHDLIHHIDDEEKDLFKKLHNFEELKEHDKKEVLHLVKEHKETYDQMMEIRKLTNDYTPKDSDCWTEDRLYKYLKELHTDTDVHVQLENYILYPKVTVKHVEKEQEQI
eukprot:CAMPEP_0117450150 /NCGR_PEP_ID=MMETSP0759-20121206/8316_1 /TAXON_ID=63605 /ORGANISM="Percolomonas cosmopolitus, Strain WS" /LENGTH=238 /DNA_ID=CAMNT_0005242655 /DNA_START=143 /DNA_END=856 /DNA_ORIENTATION=+